MHRFEAEFEQLLDKVGEETRTCVVHTYGSLAFHHVVGSDPVLLDRINGQAGFWNGVLGAQQAAAFVALGRIYDDDHSTSNLERLLRYAEQYPGLFSRTALAARKVKLGLPETDATAYAAAAFEPQRGGLGQLRTAFEDVRALYIAKAQPIRHEVFAHSGRRTREEREQLFARLPVRDLERIALVPQLVQESLCQLFANGIEPVLPDVPMVIGEVIAAAPGPNTITWRHLHAAAETKSFLKSLVADTDSE